MTLRQAQGGGQSALPGVGSPYSSVSWVDPVSRNSVRFINVVAAFSDFGIRFPYNDAVLTVSNITSNTTLSPVNGVLYYDELNISNSAVVDVDASPCFIFTRKLSIEAGSVLHADGQGAAGGTGGTVGTDVAVAGAGNDGAPADNGNSDSTKAPQYHTGISSGGSGGAGGSRGGVGGGDPLGGDGGDGGRAALTFLGPTGPTGGTGTGPDGTAGAILHATDILGSLLDYYLTHKGGAGGGGGGGGDGQGGNGGTAGAGGDGGTGGGVFIICCEILDNNGTIRSTGIDGSNGVNALNDAIGNGNGGGGGGGGSGGGGGPLLVLAGEVINEGTVTAAAGAGSTGGTLGAGVGTGDDGFAGGAGKAGGAGVALVQAANR
ncbi:MAG: hypothetical protein V3S20_06080 [Dehalococcoidia bacterium]